MTNDLFFGRLTPRPKSDVDYLHGILESIARIEVYIIYNIALAHYCLVFNILCSHSEKNKHISSGIGKLLVISLSIVCTYIFFKQPISSDKSLIHSIVYNEIT